MTTQQEAKLKELEDKADKTSEEQAVLDALLALDERVEELDAAKVAEPVSAAVATALDNVKAAVQTLADAEEKADAAAKVAEEAAEVPPPTA